MQYLLNLRDSHNRHMVVMTLRDTDVRRNAADFVFDVIGSPIDALIENGVIASGQADDMAELQNMIFGSDANGAFIREEVDIVANNGPLNPDAPFINGFVKADRDGAPYMRCDMVITNDALQPAGSGTASGAAAPEQDFKQKLDTFARMMFIHQIAISFAIDVIKELPELTQSIAEAEKNAWIEIDTQKAAYKLTAAGMKLHKDYIAEAQELIKRYDIYGDTDVDMSGNVRFDTGLGKDLRIAMFEFEGLDPYRARFLIGLNDGEWDQLSNWFENYRDPQWYELILRDVSEAPTMDDFGRDVLRRVLDAGKEVLRSDSRLRQ